MKKLSLSSITALLGLCVIPACILTVTDDVATGDEVATTDDNATTDATDDATEGATDDATDDATTTDDDVGTDDATTDATDDATDDATTTDETTDGPANMCGWNVEASYYDCGFEGADPGGTPIECPEGLVDGDSCDITGLPGEGCCDANGDNWYCTEEGVVFFMTCG
jgi:hypothetical protein